MKFKYKTHVKKQQQLHSIFVLHLYCSFQSIIVNENILLRQTQIRVLNRFVLDILISHNRCVESLETCSLM